MARTIQQAFGSCVRQFRTETGLSQEKFALKINMDRTYFASVESGRRNISLENIKKIADGLNVPISELFQSIERNDKDSFTMSHVSGGL
ncbi:helix-turn-helix domain-containing protein [Solobacterium moorei]|uniref:XRE family transcriptional regulator n=1 Tax=Solobacterium moorei TaxID=102148 RepID=A0A412PBN5_9FIRM|nr:helix-turn-helix transcriptional regulator [Solobacterium moorei]RGT54302.1 XRE family transcriptional regulator [Solobacterium moorei]